MATRPLTDRTLSPAEKERLEKGHGIDLGELLVYRLARGKIKTADGDAYFTKYIIMVWDYENTTE